ncbi:hypothetical protein ThidrDRAFT_3714 [Thiorhodococcus drewsii AZ1]|uniref:Uncharacterized protein n=1 Tax=Thiorhodococcus drewsii AZ1 TaxID=765913 RepID=G2E601_9GAMM|nr:hypothetical protein ThidrDRAFT_3714 [Thiorhodococcus drewsii AZ1]
MPEREAFGLVKQSFTAEVTNLELRDQGSSDCIIRKNMTRLMLPIVPMPYVVA